MSSDCEDDDTLCGWCRKPRHTGVCASSPLYAGQIDMTPQTAAALRALDFDNGCVNWPRDPANGRLLCTPERPMPKDAEGQWAHSGSHCTHDGEYRDWYACRDCGATWYEEIAE